MTKRLGAIFALVAIAFAFIPAVAPIAAHAGPGHRFRVTNRGDYQVDHLYFSPISANRWGPDQLGDDVIAPGHYVVWVIHTGCEQDIRVVYHNHHVAVARDFDTCRYDLKLSY